MSLLHSTSDAVGYGTPTLTSMPIPDEYSSTFSFLAGTTLYFFRTVLRVSSKNARVLRVLVVDQEGELILYSEEGDLKRQISIASSIDNVYADTTYVVMKIADDEDLVVDIHTSRSNAPEATLKRFLAVLRVFLRAEVGVQRVPNALDYTMVGKNADGTPSEGFVESLARKTSGLLKKSSRSFTAPPSAAGSTNPDVPGSAAAPPLSPRRTVSVIEPTPDDGGEPSLRRKASTFGPMSFKSRRDSARKAKGTLSPVGSGTFQPDGELPPPLSPQSSEVGLPPALVPSGRGGESAAGHLRPSPQQFGTPSGGGNALPDSRRPNFDEWSSLGGGAEGSERGIESPAMAPAASPSPRRPAAATPVVNAEAETLIADLRHSLTRLSKSNAAANIDINTLEPPAAVGFLLQEMRNDRVSWYLDDFVDDMANRQRETDSLVLQHAAAVAKRRSEIVEHRAHLQREMQDTEAKARQLEALSALVLAACRRRRLILESQEANVAEARAQVFAAAAQAQMNDRTVGYREAPSSLNLLSTPIGQAAIAPHLRGSIGLQQHQTTPGAKFFDPPPRSYTQALFKSMEEHSAAATGSYATSASTTSGAGGVLTTTRYDEALERPYSDAVLSLL